MQLAIDLHHSSAAIIRAGLFNIWPYCREDEQFPEVR
jgi:hypothetical protein